MSKSLTVSPVSKKIVKQISEKFFEEVKAVRKIMLPEKLKKDK